MKREALLHNTLKTKGQTLKSITKWTTVSLLVLALSACSHLKNPFSSPDDEVPGYKVLIKQGNELNSQIVGQVRSGMNKSEVIALLGEPQLENPFHNNVWHYVYSVSRGNRVYQRSWLVLTFTGDVVNHITVSSHL